jgi:pimeloyl-ACP methyl ester carboxylesterase
MRRRLVIGSLVLLAVLAAAWAVAAPWVEAARVLADLAGGKGAAVERLPVLYEVGGRRYHGDIYPSDGPSGVGLVIVPGAAQLGKDDPRLIGFASALARAGFIVLVPDIESQRALQVGPDNITDVADAIDWMAGKLKRVGVAAISYAVGPTVLAGLRESDKLNFLVGVGGYYDLDAVISFFTTGWYLEGGEWQKRRPNAYGKWVFVKSNAARFWDSGDRTLLELMANLRMADANAPIDALAQRLTPTGRSISDLLANTEHERVPGLIDGLPPDIRDDIRALDLKGRDLSGLKAHLLLIHGRDDAIVPAGESRKLAAAVPSASLFIVDDLVHADWTPRNPRRHVGPATRHAGFTGST